MTTARFVALTLVLGGLSGGLVALVLGTTQGVVAVGLIGALLSWIAFTVWPWAVVPVGVLGGTSVAVLAGETDIRSIVAMHLLPLAAGVAALLTRRALGLDHEQAPPPVPLGGVLVLAAVTVAGALYGLARGNEVGDVLVATYQIAVIPTYLVIAMYTLSTADWRRRSAIFYVVVVTLLTAATMFTPGRHGGLLSLLPIPLLVVCAGRSQGWRRLGLLLVAALLSLDVVLASYRGLWVAGGVALTVMAVRGTREVRRGLLGLVGVLVLLGAAFTLVGGTSGRLSVVAAAFARNAGYRGSESRIGLGVFARDPVFGAGLGQTTPKIQLGDLGVVDVGPTYHSFYVLVLANLGLVGLVAVFWPIAGVVWPYLRRSAGTLEAVPLGFAALTVGFVASAAAESPTDGHWELGLLPALTLLTVHAAHAAHATVPVTRQVRPRRDPLSGRAVPSGGRR